MRVAVSSFYKLFRLSDRWESLGNEETVTRISRFTFYIPITEWQACVRFGDLSKTDRSYLGGQRICPWIVHNKEIEPLILADLHIFFDCVVFPSNHLPSYLRIHLCSAVYSKMNKYPYFIVSTTLNYLHYTRNNDKQRQCTNMSSALIGWGMNLLYSMNFWNGASINIRKSQFSKRKKMVAHVAPLYLQGQNECEIKGANLDWSCSPASTRISVWTGATRLLILILVAGFSSLSLSQTRVIQSRAITDREMMEMRRRA